MFNPVRITALTIVGVLLTGQGFASGSTGASTNARTSTTGDAGATGNIPGSANPQAIKGNGVNTTQGLREGTDFNTGAKVGVGNGLREGSDVTTNGSVRVLTPHDADENERSRRREAEEKSNPAPGSNPNHTNSEINTGINGTVR